MKYTVLTTFNKSGLKLYGQNMINAFEKYWPDSVNLLVYAENCTPSITKNNVKVIDLIKKVPDLTAFKEKWKNDPNANGKIDPRTGKKPLPADMFRWNAIRFSHKVYAVTHAGLTCDTDWLIWLDADTKTFTSVPEEFLDEVCPNNVYSTYLGRPKLYTECGWVGYNCNHKDHKNFMNFFKNLYDSGDLFNHIEWHDSHLYDETRKKFIEKYGTKFHNLNPTDIGNSHIFINSVLGRYMDHMKGPKRKNVGRSSAHSQKANNDVKYWR